MCKCFICDKTLSAEEVQWSVLHNDFEPCGTCLMAISEIFNDQSDEEITHELEHEGVIDHEYEVFKLFQEERMT